MIRIVIDEPNSIGSSVSINLDLYGDPPTDADVMSLAQDILNSDIVQHSTQWNGPPSLTTVSIDASRQLYPAV